VTPTDTIIALEKALEAGPTPGEWTLWGRAEPSQTIASADGFIAQTVGGNDSPNAQWIAACSPLAIRTLLDAHASALRDAKELRMARDAAVSAHEVVQLAGFHFRDEVLTLRRRMAKLKAALEEVCTVLETNVTAIVDTVWVSDGSPETLLDFCRAALDDNTKGAAE
jgi:hypothetical protein